MEPCAITYMVWSSADTLTILFSIIFSYQLQWKQLINKSWHNLLADSTNQKCLDWLGRLYVAEDAAKGLMWNFFLLDNA